MEKVDILISKINEIFCKTGEKSMWYNFHAYLTQKEIFKKCARIWKIKRPIWEKATIVKTMDFYKQIIFYIQAKGRNFRGIKGAPKTDSLG